MKIITPNASRHHHQQPSSNLDPLPPVLPLSLSQHQEQISCLVNQNTLSLGEEVFWTSVVYLLTNLLQWKRLLGGIDWYHFCGYERCFCWYRENRGNDRPHMVYSIISTLNSGADLIFSETNVYYDCRGFNEITSASSNGTTNYYQIWSGSTPTINTGLTGLQNFGLFRAFWSDLLSRFACWLIRLLTDNVVAAAKANGIRLIVTLWAPWGFLLISSHQNLIDILGPITGTNRTYFLLRSIPDYIPHRSDYGGMDVYVKQILGSNYHDLFYTDTRVIVSNFTHYVFSEPITLTGIYLFLNLLGCV